MKDQLVINLLEEPIEEGEFRTQNTPNEKFRALLIDRGNQLLTKVRIVGITHGELAESGGSATLLTFDIRFAATSGRRFKSASVIFKFEDCERQMRHDPVIYAICPDGKWALNRTDKAQNVKHRANIGINAGIEPVMRTPNIGEVNVVVWRLEENGDKKDGIPTFMRAAVLLRRPHDIPFRFTVKVRTEVDFLGKIKTLFGLERQDPIDPVEVDPRNFPRAELATVTTLDPKVHDLGKMGNLDLKEVAGVRFVTVLDGTQLDGGTAQVTK